jgi:hypothetical protein
VKKAEASMGVWEYGSMGVWELNVLPPTSKASLLQLIPS